MSYASKIDQVDKSYTIFLKLENLVILRKTEIQLNDEGK